MGPNRTVQHLVVNASGLRPRLRIQAHQRPLNSLDALQSLPRLPPIFQLRNPVLVAADLERFRNSFITRAAACQRTDGEELLMTLLGEARCLDEDCLLHGVDMLYQSITQFTGGQSPAAVYSKRTGSEVFIVKLLKHQGLPFYRYFCSQDYDFQELVRRNSQNAVYVIADDVAYTGDTLFRSVDRLLRSGVSSSQIIIATCAISNRAYRRIANKVAAIFSIFFMPSLTELFTNYKTGVYEAILGKAVMETLYMGAYMSYPFYKIPDTLVAFLGSLSLTFRDTIENMGIQDTFPQTEPNYEGLLFRYCHAQGRSVPLGGIQQGARIICKKFGSPAYLHFRRATAYPHVIGAKIKLENQGQCAEVTVYTVYEIEKYRYHRSGIIETNKMAYSEVDCSD